MTGGSFHVSPKRFLIGSFCVGGLPIAFAKFGLIERKILDGFQAV